MFNVRVQSQNAKMYSQYFPGKDYIKYAYILLVRIYSTAMQLTYGK